MSKKGRIPKANYQMSVKTNHGIYHEKKYKERKKLKTVFLILNSKTIEYNMNIVHPQKKVVELWFSHWDTRFWLNRVIMNEINVLYVLLVYLFRCQNSRLFIFYRFFLYSRIWHFDWVKKMESDSHIFL